jgi:putative FmdB family regulatory protein
MPTYQYRCRKCGYEFEEFQGITDAPINTCPECEGKTERIITGGAGFVLKGSGFYSTDHRSQSYKEAEKKENSKLVAPKKSESRKEPAAKKSNESKPSD